MRKVTIVKWIGLTATALLLSACGGGEKWGIDNSTPLPKCSDDLRDNSAALKVPQSVSVIALEEGTSIRVWHYSNDEKLLCTLTGKAVISSGASE